VNVAVVELGLRERKKQAVRDRILEETLVLIGQHGIDGTTIDAICECAAIAKKTLYNYYSAKHDLATDLCQSLLPKRMAAAIDDTLASARRLPEQWEHIVPDIAERTNLAGVAE